MVLNVGEPPIALDDTASVVEDGPPRVIDVLANDTDPDGPTIKITAVTQGNNGTVSVRIPVGPCLSAKSKLLGHRHVYVHDLRQRWQHRRGYRIGDRPEYARSAGCEGRRGDREWRKQEQYRQRAGQRQRSRWWSADRHEDHAGRRRHGCDCRRRQERTLHAEPWLQRQRHVCIHPQRCRGKYRHRHGHGYRRRGDHTPRESPRWLSTTIGSKRSTGVA